VQRLHDLARKIAAEVAPEKFEARTRRARSGRRVTVRRSSEPGMADLTAHLPVEQAVACYAALRKAVNEVWVKPEPVLRGQGQIMADTLVERLTGQATAEDIDIQVHIVVPVESLLDPDSPLPAEIPGYGPVPVDLLATGKGRKTLRRLITRAGVVIGGDSVQRNFRGVLANLIKMRDGGRCTAPYCDALIGHYDHIIRRRHGGRTAFDNGRGLCAFHNHLREIGTTASRPPRKRKRRPSTAVASRVRPPGRPQYSVKTPAVLQPKRAHEPGDPARLKRCRGLKSVD
jgi:hypothetical protein